ncbi:MAG TPA: glycosyl transferase [Thiobacillus sp.]|nr:MAG: glycosyl transferase [Hydrogenophilales bacterium 28-61-11]OYZ59113.1 MAG: glycosyl transferase [Hydrogenophilales bacterium 16-61-112]OZA46466.1 MAG: glycosyl transferase [Hydrogenophilales bacterium 17-61-76]HQT31485.1 glycosyl transferase [Thiobacillus sp.]HQT70631.1 glycosyl transferase [Thiobacillus sp.]
MEHYVTLFDSLFLPQGLALHTSMERHAGEYTLWVLCMDEASFDFLKTVELPNIRLLRLAELETDALRAVKLERSIAEYCWTLTPCSIRFVFEAASDAERVTYLDADIWFRKPPAVLFRELDDSGKAVLITDHGYAPEHDQSALSGQYCVQFVTFTRAGEAVRTRWEEQCLEWCYARAEDGKYGDQKYLDEWPDRYPGLVHVLSNRELTLAPWNASRYPYGHAVFWHFHSLRIMRVRSNAVRFQLAAYPLPSMVRKFVYIPYLEDMKRAISFAQRKGHCVRPQQKLGLLEWLRHFVIAMWLQLWWVQTRPAKNM